MFRAGLDLGLMGEEVNPSLFIYYSCGCSHYYPSYYIKEERNYHDLIALECKHTNGINGQWLEIVAAGDNTIFGLMNTIRQDYYECIVCRHRFYLDEEEAEMGEPKLCSETCSKKWSH